MCRVHSSRYTYGDWFVVVVPVLLGQRYEPCLSRFKVIVTAECCERALFFIVSPSHCFFMMDGSIIARVALARCLLILFSLGIYRVEGGLSRFWGASVWSAYAK